MYPTLFEPNLIAHSVYLALNALTVIQHAMTLLRYKDDALHM